MDNHQKLHNTEWKEKKHEVTRYTEGGGGGLYSWTERRFGMSLNNGGADI